MNLKTGIFTILLISWFDFSLAADSITVPQLIRDPETLISSNGNFELGFFSPSTSMNRYLGIWFNKRENAESSLEVIWVANRDNPIQGSSSMFKLSEDGYLQVTDEQNNIFWSSNGSFGGHGSVAQLLNTGNLVLLPNGSNSVVWQSFDHPTDSMLPGAKITLQKSLNDTQTKIISWKSSTDPSYGRFRIVSLPQDLPEFFIVEGDKPYWRSGPWNGYLFLGVPYVHSEVSSGFNVDDHNDTLDLSYDVVRAPLLERFYLTYDGVLTQKFWNDAKWGIGWQSLQSECDVYGKCGKFAVCDPKKKPICECLKGFNPTNIAEWNRGNWTNGCVRRMELQCRAPGSKEDRFLQLNHIKVPDHANWIFADQDNCMRNCSANCSCLAYSFYSGIGCMFWTANLIDLQQYSADGADLFVRLAHSEVPDENLKRKITLGVVIILGALVLVISMFYLWKWLNHRNGKRATTPTSKETNWHKIFGNDFQDLRLFDFTKLVEATNNFSDYNKLGEGGFGPVYKGKWEDGEDIAVKRLSNMSGQGAEEFMNEVMVISKLQHKNLVKLLGCCVEGEEKLLIYELLPNNSLDALLFDPKHKEVLNDWPKRFNIIQGICRGLLYLHRDSRLRIIHRDLKPSNILLDEELNPKISDFGMARIFGSKQDQANTLRVVGTYGYMSPEYAMQGIFSEKSDVFSLGVLLLEIVSGKKNHGFLDKESLNLLTYAWILWNENDIVSLINPDILNQRFEGQILKCIRIALLCVQEFPEDRPDVSALIAMLDVDDVKTLPIPQSPGFTRSKGFSSDEFLQQVYDHSLTNSVSRSTASGP